MHRSMGIGHGPSSFESKDAGSWMSVYGNDCASLDYFGKRLDCLVLWFCCILCRFWMVGL